MDSVSIWEVKIKMKRKIKTAEFRPAIPDAKGELRAAFGDSLRRSGLTRSAFVRKVVELGIASMNRHIDEVNAEVRP